MHKILEKYLFAIPRAPDAGAGGGGGDAGASSGAGDPAAAAADQDAAPAGQMPAIAVGVAER